MNHPGHVAHFIIKNTLLIKLCVYVTPSSFWRPDKCSRWGGGGGRNLYCFFVFRSSVISKPFSVFSFAIFCRKDAAVMYNVQSFYKRTKDCNVFLNYWNGLMIFISVELLFSSKSLGELFPTSFTVHLM